MAVTATIVQRENVGSMNMVRGQLAWSTYTTGGDSLTATALGFFRIKELIVNPESGYSIETVYGATDSPTSVLLKVYSGAAGTSGATSGGTPAAQTFTGTLPTTGLDLVTPRFSGTGYATAGQVITTTDNQTMTLNQCRGMWFIADALSSTAPVLIISNTAVTGAPAVLTVIGTAPATDAGTYKIVCDPIPVGTNSASAALGTHTHSVGAAAGGEVSNGTDLSTPLAAVEFMAYGY